MSGCDLPCNVFARLCSGIHHCPQHGILPGQVKNSAHFYVHGPPLVVLRIINAICSSGSKVIKEYFQSCKLYLPLLENIKGIQCVFLKNLSNNSKNPLPSLLPQTVLNHLSSKLLFTPPIHTFLESRPLLPAQFFMCKSLEPHGLLSVFFLINLQPGER